MKEGTCITGWAVLFSLLASFTLAQGAQATQGHSTCVFCGMDLVQYAHSRFVIEYNDGSTFQGCSIHCAAVHLAINIQLIPRTLQVADYDTKGLIDAETATWVIGGSKPGVMTQRAKWAFEKREDAEKFIRENGGETATFDRAMRAAYEDMYSDTQKINGDRRARRLRPSGQ